MQPTLLLPLLFRFSAKACIVIIYFFEAFSPSVSSPSSLVFLQILYLQSFPLAGYISFGFFTQKTPTIRIFKYL